MVAVGWIGFILGLMAAFVFYTIGRMTDVAQIPAPGMSVIEVSKPAKYNIFHEGIHFGDEIKAGISPEIPAGIVCRVYKTASHAEISVKSGIVIGSNSKRIGGNHGVFNANFDLPSAGSYTIEIAGTFSPREFLLIRRGSFWSLANTTALFIALLFFPLGFSAALVRSLSPNILGLGAL